MKLRGKGTQRSDPCAGTRSGHFSAVAEGVGEQAGNLADMAAAKAAETR